MSRTLIEWATTSWNPIKMRCTKISPGCENCYAERMLARNLPGLSDYPKPGEPPVMDEKELYKPCHWTKPRRVFVQSMGDLFHPDVPDEMITEVLFSLYTSSDFSHTEHTWMLLTKRPDRALEFYHRHHDSMCPNGVWDYIWLGVTIENNNYRWRIDEMLKCPAAKYFVSLEPMLQGIDITPYLRNLDLVIFGPETGPHKRPFDIEWGLDIQAQCKEAGVPVFAKKLIHHDYVREWPE